MFRVPIVDVVEVHETDFILLFLLIIRNNLALFLEQIRSLILVQDQIEY
jgi:hypothetical protein